MRLHVARKDPQIKSDIQQKKYLFVYQYLYIKHGQADKRKETTRQTNIQTERRTDLRKKSAIWHKKSL